MVRKNVSYSLTHVDYTLSTAVTQIEIKRFVHSLPKTSAYGLKQQKLWLLVPPSPFLYTSVFNSEQRKQQLISLTLFCQNTVFLKPKWQKLCKSWKRQCFIKLPSHQYRKPKGLFPGSKFTSNFAAPPHY